uniref:Phytocyanin domain-containing protein n=1 Tax=Salix viminalis TaxID=40686 RepID=A0A6N2M3T0_SALVM
MKILSAAAAIIATLEATSGLKYTVGDSVWSIPPQPDSYTNWSFSHTFYIGDVLVFDFDYEFFNVMQVSRLDYESCAALSPIRIFTRSPAWHCFSLFHWPSPSPRHPCRRHRLLRLQPRVHIRTGEPSRAGWTGVSQPSVASSSPITPSAGRRQGLLMSANPGGTVVGSAAELCGLHSSYRDLKKISTVRMKFRQQNLLVRKLEIPWAMEFSLRWPGRRVSTYGASSMQLEPWIDALRMEKVIAVRQQPQQITICVVCQANRAAGGSSCRITTVSKLFLCFRVEQLRIGIKGGLIQAYSNSDRIVIR